MSKQTEMEEIYESYEYLIREKLEEIDFMARKMFLEMGVFSIPKRLSNAYVQEKFRSLANDVIRKGSEARVKHRKLRTNKRQSKRLNKNS